MRVADEIWAVVPAYQEASAVGATVAALQPHVAHVVVVDDGSTDDTASAARTAGATVIRHAVNLGQGAALATGIAFALRRGALYICTFDADGQHDPSTIEEMRACAQRENADVVLASRFRGQAVGIDSLRAIVLRAAVSFTRWQTGLPVTDTHNGLRLLTRSAAQRINISQPGMAHASEILSEIARHRMIVAEVPTVLHYTEYSKRKGQSLANSFKIVFDLFYAAWSR